MQLISERIDKSNMAILEISLPTSEEVGPDCCNVKLPKQAKVKIIHHLCNSQLEQKLIDAF